MVIALLHTLLPFPSHRLTVGFMGAKNTNSAVITTPADRLILYGGLQEIVYGKDSSYDGDAPVALIIITDISDSDKTELLLQELPSASVICPGKYQKQAENLANVLWLEQSISTQIDGINIRLVGNDKELLEAEFSYQKYCFSFSQDANYILRHSHINPDKIWIANFQRSSKAALQIAGIPRGFRLLSKKEWHPDTKLYDNYSMLIFDRKELTFYGSKEQKLLWN